jgi:hypothetical protein
LRGYACGRRLAINGECPLAPTVNVRIVRCNIVLVLATLTCSGRPASIQQLYALAPTLPDPGNPRKAALENAMKGHVVAHAVLLETTRNGESKT